MRLQRTALAAALLAATLARADTLKTDAELRPFADRVMAAVSTTGLAAGIAVMRPYVVIPEADLQAVLLKSQTQREDALKRYGKTVGYEFIGQKKLGDSLVRLTYIEKAERHAYPWQFHFYKTRNGWILNSFVWNDRLSELYNVGP